MTILILLCALFCVISARRDYYAYKRCVNRCVYEHQMQAAPLKGCIRTCYLLFWETTNLNGHLENRFITGEDAQKRRLRFYLM